MFPSQPVHPGRVYFNAIELEQVAFFSNRRVFKIFKSSAILCNFYANFKQLTRTINCLESFIVFLQDCPSYCSSSESSKIRNDINNNKARS